MKKNTKKITKSFLKNLFTSLPPLFLLTNFLNKNILQYAGCFLFAKTINSGKIKSKENI